MPFRLVVLAAKVLALYLSPSAACKPNRSVDDDVERLVASRNAAVLGLGARDDFDVALICRATTQGEHACLDTSAHVRQGVETDDRNVHGAAGDAHAVDPGVDLRDCDVPAVLVDRSVRQDVCVGKSRAG